jgi:hypothetical protein
MHPLIQDLETLKDSEVEQKITELTRKYFSTSNPYLKQQIVMVLDSYKEELSRRQQLAYEKMMQTRDKGLDKLINVN